MSEVIDPVELLPLDEHQEQRMNACKAMIDYLDAQDKDEPNFAGMQIDEIRQGGEEGRLLGLRIVFCDLEAGVITRRI